MAFSRCTSRTSTIDLRPMVARMAKELKLEARIWNDNQERGRPGKTACVVGRPRAEREGTRNTCSAGGRTARIRTHFAPLTLLPHIRPWTDEDQDVWILAFNKDLQRLRKAIWPADAADRSRAGTIVFPPEHCRRTFTSASPASRLCT